MKKPLFWLAILTGFVSHISAATVDEYRSACDGAGIQGCYQLGLAYARGEGVRQDIETARSYLTLSCDNGVVNACIVLKSLTNNNKRIHPAEQTNMSPSVPARSNVNAPNIELISYHNDRFNFVLMYPASLFNKKVLSDNGDGATLYNQDESLELRAYGSFYGNTIMEAYRDELQWAKESNDRVTYKILKKNWYIISGVNDQKQTIFYQKTYFKDGKSSSFRLTYPISNKKQYDSLVSVISKNFTTQ